MIDKIIVTTDFSECGNSALKFACGLGKQMGAKVAVLTIIEREKHESAYFIDYKPLESKENADKARRQAKDRMKKLLTDDLTQGADVTTEARIARTAVEGIVNTVDREKPDLLVMSTHGISGFRAFLLGSTFEKVLRSVTCPVLSVREECLVDGEPVS